MSKRITPLRRLEVLTRDGFRCVYCRRRLGPRNATVDHVIPAVKGGSNDDGNLVAACDRCNQAKAGMLPLNFFWRWAKPAGLRLAEVAG